MRKAEDNWRALFFASQACMKKCLRLEGFCSILNKRRGCEIRSSLTPDRLCDSFMNRQDVFAFESVISKVICDVELFCICLPNGVYVASGQPNFDSTLVHLDCFKTSSTSRRINCTQCHGIVEISVTAGFCPSHHGIEDLWHQVVLKLLVRWNSCGAVGTRRLSAASRRC